MSAVKTIGLHIFHYPSRPMPILDGRLVSYFVSENGLSFYSFPMTTVTNVDYFAKICPKKILIEQSDECHILFFDNEEQASSEFKILSELKKKFSGKPYNCNDVQMPEY
jgi:hypothetical protein